MDSDSGAHDIPPEIAALVSRLMEAAGADPSRSQTHVIGFKVVITGAGGAPAAPDGRAAQPAGDPEPEVCRIGDELCIAASLPGVAPENLAVKVENSALVLDGKNAIRPYHYTVALPPVDPATLAIAQKNGVVECRLTVLPEVPAEPGPE
jgi:Molecular chaperone (small heat shock protein)